MKKKVTVPGEKATTDFIGAVASYLLYLLESGSPEIRQDIMALAHRILGAGAVPAVPAGNVVATGDPRLLMASATYLLGRLVQVVEGREDLKAQADTIISQLEEAAAKLPRHQPRQVCPNCKREVAMNRGGVFGVHCHSEGPVCAMSHRKPEEFFPGICRKEHL